MWKDWFFIYEVVSSAFRSRPCPLTPMNPCWCWYRHASHVAIAFFFWKNYYKVSNIFKFVIIFFKYNFVDNLVFWIKKIILFVNILCSAHQRKAARYPRHRLPLTKLADLEEISILTGNLTSRPIDVLKEDKFQPGSFLHTSVYSIRRYTPGQPSSIILGSDSLEYPSLLTQPSARIPGFQYRDGPASQATFSLISDFVQYNNSKMAVADFLMNCIREYDFETDNVTTIIGVCERYSFSTRPLQSNMSVSAFTRFMVAPQLLQYVESKNSLIFHDFGYEQLLTYDFATKTVRLLDSRLYESLRNVKSLLVNEEGTELYVAHSYGLSVVNLDTMDVKRLVGETALDRGDGDRPLMAGLFSEASIGKIISLNWIYNNDVIAAVRLHSPEALLVFDLRKKVVSTHCIGKYQTGFHFLAKNGNVFLFIQANNIYRYCSTILQKKLKFKSTIYVLHNVTLEAIY